MGNHDLGVGDQLRGHQRHQEVNDGHRSPSVALSQVDQVIGDHLRRFRFLQGGSDRETSRDREEDRPVAAACAPSGGFDSAFSARDRHSTLLSTAITDVGGNELSLASGVGRCLKWFPDALMICRQWRLLDRYPTMTGPLPCPVPSVD